ncbi:lipopolysaccharide biosynthesis protein [Gordonia sp. HS-NH1]|uniref:lipopolysaccharide biosynthesis protein n=1 Tax=Gordonia sp. HS-NH1 TaxID=1435068 RepID=UPI0009FF950B|nr:oligosaccharide flippase family protein [Gordonia sp. HS-NH1]
MSKVNVVTSRLRKLPSAAVWMLVAYICSFGFQGIYFLVLARVLQASEYGTFAGALALVTVCMSFTGVGAGSVMVMRVARDSSRFKHQYGTAIVYILVSSVPLGAIAVGAGYASSTYFGQVVLILACSELIFTSLLDLGYQVNQSQDKLRRTAIFMIATAGTRLAAILYFAEYFPEAQTAASWALVYALVSVVMGISITGYCVYRYGLPKLSPTALASTWRVGIWFAIGISSRTTYVDADKYFLTRYSPGQDSTGAYAIASRLTSFATVPVQAVVYSMNTALFRAGQGGYAASWRVVRRISAIVIAYGVFAAVVVALIAPFIPEVLGDSFEDAGAAVTLLCAVPLFQGINYLFGDALMGVGQQRTRALLQGVSAAAAIGLNMVLVPGLGWVGAAVSTIAATVLLSITIILCFVLGLRRERMQARARTVQSGNCRESSQPTSKQDT